MMRCKAIMPVLTAALLLVGCKRGYEEFYFSGRVVGADLCSASTMAYIIAVDKPAAIGDTITLRDTTFSNAVSAYRSPRKLQKDEQVYGVAYKTQDFAALNCIGIYNQLPEIILLSVDEDPARMD